jgi:ubiquinone/menaquinone biosynthesis C-methylase UbiE
VTEAEAIALLGGRRIGGEGPETWADLGCGDGTFTMALATLLTKESRIHAMDTNRSALRQVPREHAGVSIVTHGADFTTTPWPFDDLDGVLLANSLHYVRDQPAFIRACAPALKQPRRFLIVEYDTDQANRWVPYPLSRASLRVLFNAAGYSSMTLLGSRTSRYQQADIYAALINDGPS